MKTSHRFKLSKGQVSKGQVSKGQVPKEQVPNEQHSNDEEPLRMFLVPCSCGTTFAAPENYDRRGTAWSRYLLCPNCAKRHDPKNRLLQVGYQREGFWQVDRC